MKIFKSSGYLFEFTVLVIFGLIGQIVFTNSSVLKALLIAVTIALIGTVLNAYLDKRVSSTRK